MLIIEILSALSSFYIIMAILCNHYGIGHFTARSLCLIKEYRVGCLKRYRKNQHYRYAYDRTGKMLGLEHLNLTKTEFTVMVRHLTVGTLELVSGILCGAKLILVYEYRSLWTIILLLIRFFLVVVFFKLAAPTLSKFFQTIERADLACQRYVAVITAGTYQSKPPTN